MMAAKKFTEEYLDEQFEKRLENGEKKHGLGECAAQTA